MGKIDEAKEILGFIGIPEAQQSDICCYALLAMAGIKPDMSWSQATNEWTCIHDIIQFANTYYGSKYKENSREVVRKQALRRFEMAALIEDNRKAINSPNRRYRLKTEVVSMFANYQKGVVIENNIDMPLIKLYLNTIELVEYARRSAANQINIVQLMTFYAIGKWIVEVQQQGKNRAEYGKQVIKKLSETLTRRFGRGFSVDTLENARKFYQTYQDRISETLFRKFAVEKSETAFRFLEESLPFTLPWSHYLQLMRIKDENERNFYEIEASREAWSVRNLQRQYNSSLYERVALSREKDKVLQLASEGNIVLEPRDIVRQPTVLEFLDLDEKSEYAESDLETAIINKLQKFLQEMGKGYLFEARQKRFTFEEDNYYVDLVCYNRLLRCYVLIDLKVDKLTHQDLGQMMMYVNYYDRFEKLPEENPTVGILLCKEKNDALVEITLPKSANIYASEYKLYLPDKKELQKKLKEWIEEET